MRNLALYRLCGTDGATVKHSNPFLPVTRPLSFTGERERCSVLTQGGDAPAWPPFCWIVDCGHSEDNSDTETMGRLFTQRIRPTRPPGRSGPPDRTAGGIGGAAPASLDLYGQSRNTFLRSPSGTSFSVLVVGVSLKRNRLAFKSSRIRQESLEISSWARYSPILDRAANGVSHVFNGVKVWPNSPSLTLSSKLFQT